MDYFSYFHLLNCFILILRLISIFYLIVNNKMQIPMFMKLIYIIAIVLVLNCLKVHAQGAKAIIMNNYVSTCKSQSFFAFNYLSAGVQMIETGQYKRAANKLSKAIKNDSTYCDAWYLAGMVYLHGTLDTVNAKKHLIKAKALGYEINSVLDSYIKR